MKYIEEIKLLRDENNALKATLMTLEKRCEQYAQAYDQMHNQLKELIRNRFGKKSERYIDPENPQFSLLDDNKKFSTVDVEGNKVENDIQISAHTHGKKHEKQNSASNHLSSLEKISSSAHQLMALKRCACI